MLWRTGCIQTGSLQQVFMEIVHNRYVRVVFTFTLYMEFLQILDANIHPHLSDDGSFFFIKTVHCYHHLNICLLLHEKLILSYFCKVNTFFLVLYRKGSMR